MLVALPTHDVIWDATLSSANDEADYPITNVQNNDPSLTARFSSISTTIVIDLDDPVTVVGVMLANTSATTGSISSTSGAIGSLTFPARLLDGKLQNGFRDLTELPNTTSDHFEIVLGKGGSEELEVGRVCLVTEWQAPHVLVSGAGQPPTFAHRRYGMVENVTKAGVTHRRKTPWAKRRRMTCATLEAATLTILRQLEEQCLSLDKGFLFVPDEDVNDAWFAQVELIDFEWVQDLPDDVGEFFPVRIVFHEIAMGLPPSPD